MGGPSKFGVFLGNQKSSGKKAENSGQPKIWKDQKFVKQKFGNVLLSGFMFFEFLASEFWHSVFLSSE